MREQIKQDIDLIEILFYLKKKIRVILFIMAICMAMVLLFLYINKDNIKVIYSLKINQTTPGILVSCDSNNNFACQTTMTEDVIQRITTFFHTSPDVKNKYPGIGNTRIFTEEQHNHDGTGLSQVVLNAIFNLVCLLQVYVQTSYLSQQSSIIRYTAFTGP